MRSPRLFYSRCWQELGRVYTDLGQPQLALEQHEAAARCSQRPDCWHELGKAALAVLDLERGSTAFEREIAEDPKSYYCRREWWESLWHALKVSNPDECVRRYRDLAGKCTSPYYLKDIPQH